jgi:hypothetical protein
MAHCLVLVHPNGTPSKTARVLLVQKVLLGLLAYKALIWFLALRETEVVLRECWRQHTAGGKRFQALQVRPMQQGSCALSTVASYVP